MPEQGSNRSFVAVYTTLGAAFLTAVAAVTTLAVYRNRHALGPPGQHCLPLLSVPTYTVTLYCLSSGPVWVWLAECWCIGRGRLLCHCQQ